MEIFIVLLVVAIIGFIWWKISTAYENKVDSIVIFYNSKLGKYKELQNLEFQVRTDGKKINIWDKQHKIDYIINYNKDEIIRTLKLYNEYVSWWKNNSVEIIKQTKSYAYGIANRMLVFGKLFVQRTNTEISKLQEKSDIKAIFYRFKTYTLHSSTARYNPRTGEWWNVDPNETTFFTRLSPDDVLLRVEILSKYNFEMTEYQYNCENQRSLMTQELRNIIIQRDKGICQICGKKCNNNEIEIDHIRPVSKGGKTIASNLQVLCISCNRSKSNKWLSEIDTKSFKKNDLNNLSNENSSADWKEFEKKYNITKYNKTNPNSGIQIGDTVTIEYVEDQYIVKGKLVEKSVSGLLGTVSIDSPIGKAICGLEVGDEIDVDTPSGIETIRIIKIEK